MGTGTVLRLLERRVGGKGVSADSGSPFLPWFGRSAVRSEAAHWAMKQRGEINGELVIIPERRIMPCIKNRTWHARIKAFQATSNDISGRPIYIRSRKHQYTVLQVFTCQAQTNKTPSFRKHRSYVHLCISLRSMQLAGSSALLQCNGLYDAACRWWRQRGSVPVPCPCAEGGQAPEVPSRGCAVPAGPFPLWAPARKVSELCGKRKGSQRSKWTKCHAWAPASPVPLFANDMGQFAWSRAMSKGEVCRPCGGKVCR